jgi:putative phosphoesterase
MPAAGHRGRRYRVGVLADTHVGDAIPVLPSGVAEALAGVDLIIHAGDVSVQSVVDELGTLAPVVAVLGNHDRRAGLELPEARVVRIGDVRIGVTHGDRGPVAEVASAVAGIVAGRPVMAGVPRVLTRRFGDVDCVVFGHFHTPFLGRVGGITVFSPGAVYVVEADPLLTVRGPRGRAYRRYRAGLPDSARVPQLGILEIADGVIVPRFVPISGPLRGVDQP